MLLFPVLMVVQTLPLIKEGISQLLLLGLKRSHAFPLIKKGINLLLLILMLRMTLMLPLIIRDQLSTPPRVHEEC